MKKLLFSLFLALLAYQPALGADTAVPSMTATTTPLSTDILYIVVDPSGTPLDRKVTVGNLFGAFATPLTGLTENTAPIATDILYLVDDPGGSPLSQKVTVGNLSKGMSAVGKVAVTQPASSATLTIADGKTLTASNTMTLAGTDGSTLNIGAAGTLGTGAFLALDTAATPQFARLGIGAAAHASIALTSTAASLGFGLNLTGNSTGRRAYTIEGDSSSALLFRRYTDSFAAAASTIWKVDNQITTDTFHITAGSLDLSGFGTILAWGGGLTQVVSDGANIVHQRNSTTAQKFRVGNTFTTTSNMEYAGIEWAANVAQIGAFTVGGTLRNVQIVGTQVSVDSLKTTGAATGKTVVCVDVTTGQLYASTSGVACAN